MTTRLHSGLGLGPGSVGQPPAAEIRVPPFVCENIQTLTHIALVIQSVSWGGGACLVSDLQIVCGCSRWDSRCDACMWPTAVKVPPPAWWGGLARTRISFYRDSVRGTTKRTAMLSPRCRTKYDNSWRMNSSISIDIPRPLTNVYNMIRYQHDCHDVWHGSLQPGPVHRYLTVQRSSTIR